MDFIYELGKNMYPVLGGLSVIGLAFSWFWRTVIKPLHNRLEHGMDVLDTIDYRMTVVEKALGIMTGEDDNQAKGGPF